MFPRRRQGGLSRESGSVRGWWICLLKTWSIVRRLGILCLGRQGQFAECVGIEGELVLWGMELSYLVY